MSMTRRSIAGQLAVVAQQMIQGRVVVAWVFATIIMLSWVAMLRREYYEWRLEVAREGLIR